MKEVITEISNILVIGSGGSGLRAAIEAKESDIAAAELKTRQQLRRSIYAATDLGPGDILTADAIVIKSPGDGLSAKLYDTVVGCRLVKGISADSPLSWDNLINR